MTTTTCPTCGRGYVVADAYDGWLCPYGCTGEPDERLEYLRGELRAERISYSELAELQSLAEHIAPDDVELLEAAGVSEFGEGDDGDAA